MAAAGRLRMSVERATQLMHANGVGLVPSLISAPPPERDPELAAVVLEHVLRTITTTGDVGPEAPTGVVSRAAALREALRDSGTTALTQSERALPAEWLDRLADTGEPGPADREAPARRDDRNAHG
ncbi:hypothetical protein ACWDZ8_21955 [Streptomyces sp. NPDC003233]